MSKEIREFVDVDGVRKKKSWIERVKEKFRKNVPFAKPKKAIIRIPKAAITPTT